VDAKTVFSDPQDGQLAAAASQAMRPKSRPWSSGANPAATGDRERACSNGPHAQPKASGYAALLTRARTPAPPMQRRHHHALYAAKANDPEYLAIFAGAEGGHAGTPVTGQTPALIAFHPSESATSPVP